LKENQGKKNTLGSRLLPWSLSVLVEENLEENLIRPDRTL